METNSFDESPMGGNGIEDGDWEFPSTRWSLVFNLTDRDSPTAQAAFEWLCRSYWRPIYAYIRRKGCTADDACDLTQGFFAVLLDKPVFRSLELERGRFRAYLLACCKNFLSNTRDHEAALKRGGNRRVFSIHARDAEEHYLAEPIDTLTPEACFDRHWALSVLDSAAKGIEDEYEKKGKLELFRRLRSFIFDETESLSHAEIAESLGMSTDSVKKAAQRLRERYRNVLREQVARTVSDPSLVQDELRDLLAALAATRRS